MARASSARAHHYSNYTPGLDGVDGMDHIIVSFKPENLHIMLCILQFECSVHILRGPLPSAFQTLVQYSYLILVDTIRFTF